MFSACTFSGSIGGGGGPSQNCPEDALGPGEEAGITKKLDAFKESAAIKADKLAPTQAADLHLHIARGHRLQGAVALVSNGCGEEVPAQLASLDVKVVRSWKRIFDPPAPQLWFVSKLATAVWPSDVTGSAEPDDGDLHLALCARVFGGLVVDDTWLQASLQQQRLVTPVLHLSPAMREALEIVVHSSFIEAAPWAASVLQKLWNRCPPQRCSWVLREDRESIRATTKALVLYAPDEAKRQQKKKQKHEEARKKKKRGTPLKSKHKGVPLDPSSFLVRIANWAPPRA